MPSIDAESTVSDYEAAEWYLNQYVFYTNPIYMSPSIRGMRREYRDRRRDRCNSITGGSRPHLKSTIDACGMFLEQVAFWRPLTPTGRLVARVLRDMEREQPKVIEQDHPWRDSDVKTVVGVPLRDILYSAILAATAAFVVVLPSDDGIWALDL